MSRKEWLAFIGLGLMWGSSFYWIKIALVELGPVTLVAQRLLFAAIALGLLAFYRKSKAPIERAEWGALVVLGLTNVAFPFVLTSWGELHIDSAVASITLSTVPLITTVIAYFYLRDDRLTAARAIGLLLGFAGVVVLILRDAQINLESSLFGQAALLGAAVLYSISGVYAKRRTKNISLTYQAFFPILVADIAIWAVLPFVESPLKIPASPEVWMAILWLGMLGSGAAYLLYFYLLHAIGPTRTSLVTYTFPLTGIVMGVLFLGERLDFALILGALLVVGSLLIVNRKN